MAKGELTVRNVLPSDMVANYPNSVLDVPMDEFLNVAKFDRPPTSKLSPSDIRSLKEIYEKYRSSGGEGADSDSAFWNRSESDNQAFWKKEAPKAEFNESPYSGDDLTVRNVLPSHMVANYPDAVLRVTMTEFLNVAKYGKPPTSDLSSKAIQDLKEIYNAYRISGGKGAHSDSAYWNRSESDNEAFWKKETV